MSATLPVEPTHVAGIAASAGGLEALLPLFAQAPTTGHVAYVLAQHMARDGHAELLARLISHGSTLPVRLVAARTRLQADTIYIIPSAHHGEVRGRDLHLLEAGADAVSAPSANRLFASLAASHGKQAIGIVLSGTGSDGSAGCRAIRAAGGLTLAQQPGEARFDGMPGAAIEAGVIDRVLPVGAIVPALAARFPDRSVASNPAPAPGDTVDGAAEVLADTPADAAALAELTWLLAAIRRATGIDFSGYKEETLLRRLEKRKSELNLPTSGADSGYRLYCQRHPEEWPLLQQRFLVSVSSFFRDAEAFAALGQALVPLLAAKAAGVPVRAWVPGCATGEEAYSLALLLRERHAAPPARVLGSDLNAEALAAARGAHYRPSALRELDPVWRERYFEAVGDLLRPCAALREQVRFEQRDVLASAPAGPFDLISCRNLLIYLKPAVQDRLLTRFHELLPAHGLLFLGHSESLGFLGNALFAPVDTYHRLFRRRP